MSVTPVYLRGDLQIGARRGGKNFYKGAMIMNKLKYLGITALALVLFSYGAARNELYSQSTAGSCNLANRGLCVDFVSGYTSERARRSCSLQNGTFTAGSSCARKDSSGTCLISRNSGTLRTVFYPPVWSKAQAASRCAAVGGK